MDSFETGQEIPSCQIRAEWTKQGKPSQLTHEVILKGAKEPNNYFYIELDSTSPGTTEGEFMVGTSHLFIGSCSQLLHHSVIISNVLTRKSALL